MIKRVNFTGRKRIPRDRADVAVFAGSPRRFEASIRLQDLHLPPDAAVVLEATSAGSSIVQRFEFGTVSGITPPAKRELTEVEGERVMFTLKVIDRTKQIGRLLGIAEQVPVENAGASTDSGKKGILPIEEADLKQELWRLHYTDQHVTLLVNKQVPGLKDRARADAVFFAVVYPEIVRQVLAAAIDQNVELDDDDIGWPVQWLKFGVNLHPMQQNPPSKSDDVTDRQLWIEDVVEAFCNAHTLKDKFVAEAVRSEGDEP